MAVQAGTDTTCGDEYVALVQAVQDGLIKESEIDTALKRLFTARFRLGMFDPPDAVAFNQIPFSEDDSPQHRQLALRAARESMVLLKNQDGILPFKANFKTLAVIGPNAESLAALEGNYNGTPSHPGLSLGWNPQSCLPARRRFSTRKALPIVEQLPVPVPSTRLSYRRAVRAAQGLKAEYFSNTDFSGKPVLTRVDPQIQFDWNAAAPAPGVSKKAFAVRWTGTLDSAWTGRLHVQRAQARMASRTVARKLTGSILMASRFLTPRCPPTRHGPRKTRKTCKPHFRRTSRTRRHMHSGLNMCTKPQPSEPEPLLSWQPPVEVLRNEAVKAAQQADAVVAFVGLSPDLEGEEMPIQVPGFQGGDRTDIGLPEAQQQLLEALAATGKPLVVVLMSGSAVAVNWAQEHAAAMLEAWYPGEEGGTAIAETLAGVNNPAGRLPVTFYASLDQLPPFDDYSMQNRTYRYFQGKPLYGFGYGLSYSTFEYSNLKLSPPQLQAGAPLTVQVDVRNTSKIAGDEVAELYLEFPPIAGAPARALRGFARVHLLPGENRHLSYTLKARDLSMVNEHGRTRRGAGRVFHFRGWCPTGGDGERRKGKVGNNRRNEIAPIGRARGALWLRR